MTPRVAMNTEFSVFERKRLELRPQISRTLGGIPDSYTTHDIVRCLCEQEFRQLAVEYLLGGSEDCLRLEQNAMRKLVLEYLLKSADGEMLALVAKHHFWGNPEEVQGRNEREAALLQLAMSPCSAALEIHPGEWMIIIEPAYSELIRRLLNQPSSAQTSSEQPR